MCTYLYLYKYMLLYIIYGIIHKYIYAILSPIGHTFTCTDYVKYSL